MTTLPGRGSEDRRGYSPWLVGLAGSCLEPERRDIIAIAVLDAARRAGMRVPEELSIIGFDDIPMSSWHSFRLTTVHQDIQGMAIQAARCLIESIQNPDHHPAHYRYPASLTVRGTTAQPRS